MESVLWVFGVGILLGIMHAFDVDHVVAVNTLITKSKNIFGAIETGVFWGMGHTLTLVVVGFLVMGLKVFIPNTVSLFLELCVALMLIVLGVGTLHRRMEGSFGRMRSSNKSFGIGMVHGLAGSGALLLLLLPKIGSLFEGLFYVLVFGLGSILGMLFVGVFLFFTIKKIESYSVIKRNISIPKIAGTLSILVGVFLFVEIGFVEGLFLL